MLTFLPKKTSHLNFDIAWIDLVVTTTDGFTYDSGSIIHTFTDLSQGVKSVKGYIQQVIQHSDMVLLMN